MKVVHQRLVVFVDKDHHPLARLLGDRVDYIPESDRWILDFRFYPVSTLPFTQCVLNNCVQSVWRLVFLYVEIELEYGIRFPVPVYRVGVEPLE